MSELTLENLIDEGGYGDRFFTLDTADDVELDMDGY